MTIDLTGKVAIVTGAGNGLGRAHACLLAKRGAKVVINDLGANVNGEGAPTLSAAIKTADELTRLGYDVVADGASVTDYPRIELMVAETVDRWGRVDILVNNAGILRDKTFAKMTIEDFRAVLDVHLMGAINCIKAVWPVMRDQNFGRIVLTTSSSGLYGNFGQSNYGAAKMALVGLMQTLALEGEKYNIRVNSLAPTAATRMLDGLLPQEQLDLLTPEAVSPAMLALVANDAPTRTILCAGAGSYEQANITLTKGVYIGARDDAPEQVLARLQAIADRKDELIPKTGAEQGALELEKAGYRPA